jgi:hypothetical protein
MYEGVVAFFLQMLAVSVRKSKYRRKFASLMVSNVAFNYFNSFVVGGNCTVYNRKLMARSEGF